MKYIAVCLSVLLFATTGCLSTVTECPVSNTECERIEPVISEETGLQNILEFDDFFVKIPKMENFYLSDLGSFNQYFVLMRSDKQYSAAIKIHEDSFEMLKNEYMVTGEITASDEKWFKLKSEDAMPPLGNQYIYSLDGYVVVISPHESSHDDALELLKEIGKITIQRK